MRTTGARPVATIVKFRLRAVAGDSETRQVGLFDVALCRAVRRKLRVIPLRNTEQNNSHAHTPNRSSQINTPTGSRAPTSALPERARARNKVPRWKAKNLFLWPKKKVFFFWPVCSHGGSLAVWWVDFFSRGLRKTRLFGHTRKRTVAEKLQNSVNFLGRASETRDEESFGSPRKLAGEKRASRRSGTDEI